MVKNNLNYSPLREISGRFKKKSEFNVPLKMNISEYICNICNIYLLSLKFDNKLYGGLCFRFRVILIEFFCLLKTRDLFD